MTLEHHPESSRETHEAIAENERIIPVLAAEYTEAVLKGEDEIQLQPLRYAIAEDSPSGFDVRERVLARFPFRVLYLSDSAGILVLAVAHHSRQPGYWHDRLSNEWQ